MTSRPVPPPTERREPPVPPRRGLAMLVASSARKEQMQKLWGLDAFVCDALVDALVAARVLRRTADGAYVVHGAGV
jgi:hypothetical protein